MKSLYASAIVNGKIPLEETNPKDKRKASSVQFSPGSSPDEKAPQKKKKEKPGSGIPVGSGAKSGQK